MRWHGLVRPVHEADPFLSLSHAQLKDAWDVDLVAITRRKFPAHIDDFVKGGLPEELISCLETGPSSFFLFSFSSRGPPF